ncbi:MAG TPA: UvrD-helicase domain-containing protein, partial [Anaerolineae bacterium]|nr:UvrD-helicase domain-containing protein [Anaerolineae bacterium]
MSTERFTTEQFEAALPVDSTTGEKLWESLGMVQGERAYAVAVKGTNKRIIIRSSIGVSGVAASSGQDSIRLWAEYYYPKADEWFSLAKLDAWTTRVSGWERRMTEKLRELWKLCQADSAARTSTNAPHTPPPHTEPEDALDFLGADVEKQAPGHEDDDEAEEGRPYLGPGPAPADKAPNPEQLAAIEAPIDAAVRVLAPPGSGKTFVLSHRYIYLVQQGVKPENILMVCFNKSAADAMQERVFGIMPELAQTAAASQISTIHAACYRMLPTSGLRVAKAWQLKRFIRDEAEKLWNDPDNRPGWEEINDWIVTSKGQGLAPQESGAFLRANLGEYHGERVYKVNVGLANYCKGAKLITFADMLLRVDLLLERDTEFRGKTQARFTHLLVDEGQDTTHQAMRILTTIAAPQD